MKSLGSLLLSTLVAGALVLGSVSASAVADDVIEPVPTASAEPTSEPTGEPAEEPTAEPSATPTAEPEPSSSPVSSDVPKGVAPPRGAVTPAAPGSQDLTGRITELSDHSSEGSVKVLQVDEGYLLVDFAAVELPADTTKPITVRVTVPASITPEADGTVPFAALAGVDAPLVATQLLRLNLRAPGVEAMVNQTPATTATHQVYAVAVTPANVCGASCAVTSGQSAANIQLDVAASNSYWLSQSDGKIGFELVGTTAWYKSAFSCDANVPANFVKLLNEATTKATAQIGYVHTPNSHLVLIFPHDSNCGPAIGLGTVGSSINDAGALWAIGSGRHGATNYPSELHTLAHELGHNLSLGHSDWLDCSAAAPAPGRYGISGCVRNEYGDASDVMGIGNGVTAQGSLSSPHAIRSGMWDAASFTPAPNGTSTHLLKPLSSGTGLRSVVVEGSNGVNYFIEYRDTSGIDAPYASFGCGSPYADFCAAPVPGVRILQLEQQTLVDSWGDSYEFKGYAGDNSMAIGRTVGGVKKLNLVAGETLAIGGSGVSVTVTSINGSGASVSVSRTGTFASPGLVYIEPTAGSGSMWPWYSGDTLTGLLGSDWKADSYTYRWMRNGFAISGATSQSYTLTASDVGQDIGVEVTSVRNGVPQSTRTDPDLSIYTGYGPIQAGITQGTVGIDASTIPFTATISGWVTSGTTFAYQWRRNGAAIAGATSSSYTPTALDDNALLSVRLVATKSGNPTVVAVSTSKNYTLTPTGSFVISGTAEVGYPLTVASAPSYSTVDGPVFPNVTVQWLRSGVAIAGATASSYTLTAADFGKTITVRGVARASGYASSTSTSAATIAVARGEMPGTLDAPVVTKDSALKLTVALPAGSVTEPGVTNLYQWYRDGAAIAGAAASTFQLTAADHGKAISARIIVTKVGLHSVALYSTAVNYSLLASGSLTTDGFAKVGQVLSPSALSYSTVDGPADPALAYQWYRNGVALAGATGYSYTAVAADFGTKLSVRVTASTAGYLPHVATSTPSVAVVKGSLSGSLAAPEVSKNTGTMKLTAALAAGSITDSGTTVAYQWFRNGVAIAAATTSTFQLTAADYGKTINARLVVSKLNYDSVTLLSDPVNYSLVATGSLTASGVAQVGLALTATEFEYSTNEGTVAPTPAYQWLRNGVAIAGATGSSYTAVAADFGTKLSVRASVTYAGYLAHSATSPQTAAVAKGVLSGDLAAPTVSASATVKLTAALPVGSVTDPGTALAYQWLRNGVAIAGATASTFQLTAAADYGKDISVRVTVSKLNYTSAVLTSVPANYSVTASGLPVLDQPVQVGNLLQVFAPTFTPGTASVTYQWLRNGVAIAGATTDEYELVNSDLGATISARVTASLEGYLPSISTSAATQKVGVVELDWDVPVAVTQSGLVLTAIGAVDPEQAPATYARQWLRNGVAIVGATAATYTLVAADLDKAISVRVTASKPTFTTVVATSAARDYSVVATGALTAAGTAKVGESLTASLPSYSTVDGAAAPALAYQWLRNGVAIAGATGASYTAVAADFNTKLSVRATATLTGFLPRVSTSAQTAAVVKGSLSGSLAAPEVSKNSATLKLTAALAAGSVTDAGTAVAYQWFRNGVAIPLATASTFQLTAADYGKTINARLVVSKLNYDSVTLLSAPVNYSVTATGSLAISGAAQVGVTVSVNALEYATADGAITPTPAYQWLRNGVAIAGATGSSYAVVAADFGTKLTVRVTAAEAGFLSSIVTSPATAAVVKGVLSGDLSKPTVTKDTVTMKLTGSLTPGSVTDAGIAVAYQWLRNGVAITGATTPVYTLVAADYGQEISVRLTVTKLNYTTVTLVSVPTVP